MIPIGFVARESLEAPRLQRILAAVLFLTLVTLIRLRAARVVSVEIGGSAHNFLVGSTLTPKGIADKKECAADSTEQLVGCSGPEDIPLLFGGSYRVAYYGYIGDYLLMLAIFVLLVSALDLKEERVGVP